ncbi:hypothetical protein [Telmatospirillum sp.]|uniref:hypothetical protein n=1 Tax=Telmatospirillum sp. TaxID=2079197 RepID=UPI00283E6ACB|nr:hypothetical protein [Telmatospirillum sp.]MDR3438908.1 hypothetical protein [Telmatospirillum sp.]
MEFLKAIGLPHGADKGVINAAKEQASQLQEALYAAKDTIGAQKDRIASLVEQAKALEVRISQREEYVLEPIGPGAFAYIRKAAHDAQKKGPWLCQPCFDDGKQSVLQFSKTDWHRDAYKCPRCEAILWVPNNNEMRAQTASLTRGRFDDF